MRRIEIDLNAAPLNEQLPDDVAIGFTAFGTAITNPWKMEDGMGSVLPLYYGFRKAETGGGLEAWESVRVEDGIETEYLITDREGAYAPTRDQARQEGWMLGCYISGEPLWLISVGPDGKGWVEVEGPEEETPRFHYDARAHHDSDEDWDIAIVETATDTAVAMTHSEEKAERIVSALNAVLTDREKEALRYVWGGMGDGYASDILQRLWE